MSEKVSWDDVYESIQQHPHVQKSLDGGVRTTVAAIADVALCRLMEKEQEIVQLKASLKGSRHLRRRAQVAERLAANEKARGDRLQKEVDRMVLTHHFQQDYINDLVTQLDDAEKRADEIFVEV